jgi:hypothetical protein
LAAGLGVAFGLGALAEPRLTAGLDAAGCTDSVTIVSDTNVGATASEVITTVSVVTSTGIATGDNGLTDDVSILYGASTGGGVGAVSLAPNSFLIKPSILKSP